MCIRDSPPDPPPAKKYLQPAHAGGAFWVGSGRPPGEEGEEGRSGSAASAGFQSGGHPACGA
eukprot:8216622-Alexandrium_andersonii.AAC.1